MRDYLIVVEEIEIDGKKEEMGNEIHFFGESKTNYKESREQAMSSAAEFVSTLKTPFKFVWREYRRNTFGKNTEWKYVGTYNLEVNGD